MQNPTNRFKTEPFPEQKQDWPALQRDMHPVPDCGETSYRGSSRLAGRKALVTGGDSGIGRAAANAFAREGAAVAINYYPTEEPDAQDVADLLRGEGHEIDLIPGDLTDAAFCKELVRKAGEALGGLDLIVNNAAYQQSKASIEEISDEQFDRTMKTNIYAMFHISTAAIPLLKPGASIINTASVNSVSPGEELPNLHHSTWRSLPTARASPPAACSGQMAARELSDLCAEAASRARARRGRCGEIVPCRSPYVVASHRYCFRQVSTDIDAGSRAGGGPGC